jgi:hypothetical protein
MIVAAGEGFTVAWVGARQARSRYCGNGSGGDRPDRRTRLSCSTVARIGVPV